MTHTLTAPPIDPDVETTSTDTFAPEPPAPVQASSRSFFERHDLSQRDVLLGFAALLLTCAYLPILYTWWWTPRLMVIIASAPVGLVALISLARQRDLPARFALLALAWACLSAALSGEARLAFMGHVVHETHVLAYAGAIGLWALARGMSTNGRRLLVPLAVGAFAINVAVATIQVLTARNTGELALQGSRAIGLTPNSGLFGAYTVAAGCICVWRSSRASSTRVAVAWIVGAGLFGIGLAFSGSRIGVGAMFLVGSWIIISERRWMPLVASVASAVGLAAGSLIAQVAGSASSLSRSGELRSGGRGDMWSSGFQAFLERPVTGWGLGRYRTAVQGDWTFEWVAQTGDRQSIPDAHNIIVTLLVAVGLPGLILFALFVLACARRARGPLALAAAGIAITWLFQPTGIATLPIAMLLLGASIAPTVATSRSGTASGRVVDGDDPDGNGEPASAVPLASNSRSASALLAVALLVGLGASAWLGVADYRLAQASATVNADEIDAVVPMFGDDPLIHGLATRAWGVRASINPDARVEMIARAQDAVDAEPKRPYWWTQLASAQGQAGQIEEAVASARQALELQPTSLAAWQILLVAAGDLGDDAMAEEALTSLCRLEADECRQ